jgi:hypothetical protein
MYKEWSGARLVLLPKKGKSPLCKNSMSDPKSLPSMMMVARMQLVMEAEGRASGLQT